MLEKQVEAIAKAAFSWTEKDLAMEVHALVIT